jgi:hypothetical protein
LNSEPVLGKRAPHPRDYQLMTWPLFLTLRTWATEAAQRVGAPVYLVGSALRSDRPRDIDLSFILPAAAIVERFGPLPPTSGPQMHAYMDALHAAIVDEAIVIQCAVEGRWTLDVKLCPDCWWADQDRLLLAAPKGTRERT